MALRLRLDRSIRVDEISAMASAAARSGRLVEAERLLREAVALEPFKSESQEALSWVLLQQNRPIEAIELLDRLLTADPRNSSLATRRAWILGQLGRFDEAIAVYLEQLQRSPERPSLHIALGRSLLAVDRDREAIACYRRALELGDRSGEAWWSLANVKTIRFSLSEIGDMGAFLDRGDIGREAATRVHFALGKAHEDLGHYEHSFRHYEQGNRSQAETAFASGDRVRTLVDRSISLFTPEFFRQRGWLGSPESSPIFIVGMPRSGTTLVEQILASHSAIEGTSELPNMNAIAQGLVEELKADDGEYVSRLATLHRSRFHELGRRYIEQARPYRRTDRPYFIDKMPSNWQHIGLIHLILPRAKIIDVRRDSLDCCFSNFAQYFPKGHEFTHSLGALGRHYRAYEDLMAHFDEVRPRTVYRLVYEDLVDRPETEIRKLLKAIGVPFEESCLRFFDTARPVLTPSAQQVRQPINRRGVGRSRPFAPWLAPLQRELQGAA